MTEEMASQFRADQPIRTPDEDIRGRKDIARSLATALLDYTASDSIVLGMYGSWGSGKTSILNMTLSYVDESTRESMGEDKPIILQFNPWNYSDQDQLLTQFFKVMSVHIKSMDSGMEAQKIGELLETYSSFFDPLALLPQATVPALVFKGVLKSVGKAAKEWGKLKQADLESTKDRLSKALEERGQRILVLIDDIDRLTNDEIRQIFQLVKNLADFPNTVYLLSFDRHVVVRALKKVQEGDEKTGDTYLGKIVQIPFEVPDISRVDLQRYLFAKLDEIIKPIPDAHWNAEHWQRVYQEGLSPLFRSLRDVTRFTNSLRFSFAMVKGEVNPVDFIAITSVQVFAPDMYLGIRDNRDVFAGEVLTPYGDSTSLRETLQRRYSEILDRAPSDVRQGIDQLLRILFPKLRDLDGKALYSSDNSGRVDHWRREYRICSTEIFPSYFLLATPEGELRRSEMEAFLAGTNSVEAFSETLMNLSADGRITRFLQRFEDYTGVVSLENIQNVISALMDLGDDFPAGEAGFWGFDNGMHILRITHQLLRRLESQSERHRALAEAIGNCHRSLYTVVHEVGVQGQEHGKRSTKEDTRPVEQREIDPEHLADLEQMALAKIEEWKMDGRLAQHEKLIPILFSWAEWTDDERVRTFVSDLVQSREGLVRFVTACLWKSQSRQLDSGKETTTWKFNMETFGKWLDVQSVEGQIRELASDQEGLDLTERNRLALSLFVDTRDGNVSTRPWD